MEPWRAWLLIGLVFGVLLLFWWMLNFTFDLIERAHKRLREAEEME